MALLTVRERQKYLKELGFYKGEIDGSAGPLTKQAYKNLQNRYFTRAKDKDGLYGINTDTLLRSAYNCKNAKYFRLEEFKCKCGGASCTGYPVVLNANLVSQLDKLREHYGKSCTITSGLRDTIYNKKVGGVTNSEHTKGRAADIYLPGQSSSHGGRVAMVDYWDTMAYSKYAYCNGYMKYKGKKPTEYKSSSMGNATHVNVI